MKNFAQWLLLQESSLEDLYKSAVVAFPGTTRRQHAVDPIKISEVKWIPYLGTKTLLVRAIAESGNSVYNPIVMFTDVKYGSGDVSLAVDDNKNYILEQLSMSENDVKIRCNCEDFYWRWNYWDHLDNSLYGRKRSPYEAKTNRGPVNPTESEGMCKHLMKLMKVLNQSGLMKG